MARLQNDIKARIPQRVTNIRKPTRASHTHHSKALVVDDHSPN